MIFIFLAAAHIFVSVFALFFQSSLVKDLGDVLTNPLVIKTLVFYWCFSALVGALPSPEKVKATFAEAGRQIGPLWMLFYQMLFSALHGLSGNLSRAAVAFKVPGAKEEA